MVEIPIAENDSRIQYLSTGGEPNFSYDFPIFDEADIEVLRATDSTSEAVTLVLTTDYTVTGVGLVGGGTVVPVVTPVSGQIWTLQRNVPEDRLADFAQGGPYIAATVNKEEDRQIMMLQQLRRDIDRSLRLSDGDTATSLTLPLKDVRKSLFAAYDSNGDPIATDAPADAAAAAAAASEAAAAASEANAATSETNAESANTAAQSTLDRAQITQFLAGSAQRSKNSATASAAAAATSEANAATSESNAGTSESNAATSESNAASSASAAATSESNASTSETNAAASEAAASTSETNAATSETNASASEVAAEAAADRSQFATGASHIAVDQARKARLSATEAAVSAATISEFGLVMASRVFN